jgi:hypothetical protein
VISSERDQSSSIAALALARGFVLNPGKAELLHLISFSAFF